jgi:hypothetical protein
VIVAGTSLPPVPSQSFSYGQNGSLFAMSMNIANIENQTWLIQVTIADVNGNESALAAAPGRDVYFFGSQGTRTLTASAAMLATDSLINCNATSGAITYTSLAFSSLAGRQFTISKTDSSSNNVTLALQAGDSFDDGTTSVALSTQGASFTWRVQG